MAPRRLFALDQNFPEPIVHALDDFLDCAELVPLRSVDDTMPTLDDPDLLLAIRVHERPWDGLITSDDSMLNEPDAMAMLRHTGLTLVIAHGQGHNPIRATGLLFVHLHHICQHTSRGKPQIWILRSQQKEAESPDKHLAVIAAREKTTVPELLARFPRPGALTARARVQAEGAKPDGSKEPEGGGPAT